MIVFSASSEVTIPVSIKQAEYMLTKLVNYAIFSIHHLKFIKL